MIVDKFKKKYIYALLKAVTKSKPITLKIISFKN